MSKTRVHRILDEVGTLAFAGIFDTLSAKLAQQVGFPMAFVSGYSVAATAIGEPDMGLLTQTEITERARRICMSVDIPIIVDADTGYGNPLNVYRTVQELIAAGAAGCFLEDQLWPKKCGHMKGKRVIERDEYVQKIRAAVEARGDRDFFIVARTDALAVVGMEEAVARILAAREAGADASFIEAPDSVEQLAEIGRRVPKPMVANMIEGGRTPVLPAATRRAGIPVDPLSAGRAVCGGKGDSHGLRASLPRRHDDRQRIADDFHGVQRADRRHGEICPGRTVWRVMRRNREPEDVATVCLAEDRRTAKSGVWSIFRRENMDLTPSRWILQFSWRLEL